MNLARLLSLQPLDRLQIATTDAVAKRKARIQLNPNPISRPTIDLHWSLFQHVQGDRLVCIDPHGHVEIVQPHEVCNVARGEPIPVNAMPRTRYLDWLRRSADRTTPPPQHYFADAFVLHVTKSTCGDITRCAVWFVDAELNDETGFWYAPLRDDSWVALRTASKLRPPTLWRTSTPRDPASIARDAKQAARAASAFIAAATCGDAKKASKLAQLGPRP